MQAAAVDTARSDAVLCLRNISKAYGPVQVLSQVNVDIRPGEVLALLGENGAGKSTLSSIIAGLVQPEAGGSMTWLGAPYAPASPGAALGAGIGLIHQEIRLLPQLSIAENIFVGRLPMRRGRVDREYMEAQAQIQLERLGLKVPASRKVEGLSVAAQQLVEIAKALTLKASLLILDEPTAALGGEETELLNRAAVQAGGTAQGRGCVVYLYQPPSGRNRTHRRPRAGAARRSPDRFARHGPGAGAGVGGADGRAQPGADLPCIAGAPGAGDVAGQGVELP
jgi:ABC-type sugar transport system, ATPase component